MRLAIITYIEKGLNGNFPFVNEINNFAKWNSLDIEAIATNDKIKGMELIDLNSGTIIDEIIK